MRKCMAVLVCVSLIIAISGCVTTFGMSGTTAGFENATSNNMEVGDTIFSTSGGPTNPPNVVEGFDPIPTETAGPNTTAPHPTAPDATAPESTTGSGQENSIADLYFDYAQDHKPTEEEIHMVTDAMPSADVIELLGKPHDGGPTSGLTSLAWQTDEGNWYYIVFISAGNAPDDISAMDRIFYYSVCSPAIYMDV